MFSSLFEFIVELLQRNDDEQDGHNRKDEEIPENRGERQSLDHQFADGVDIPAGRNDARKQAQNAGHVLDRKNHAREHDERHEHKHGRDHQRRHLPGRKSWR